MNDLDSSYTHKNVFVDLILAERFERGVISSTLPDLVPHIQTQF